MIIMDTCVVRAMKLDGSEAHLLRAIRETRRERVAVPWMVMEERAAQLAIEYGKAHEKAQQALRQLQRAAPVAVPDLDDPDLEAVRQGFRERLTQLVDVLEPSEPALREGMYREANVLPPAGWKKELKTGARDVAIWLSAVEYAKEHPEETVYFVSSNTKDFTAGGGDAAYPHPMDKDVEGLGARFVHLPQLSDLLELVAPTVTVSPEQVDRLLESYSAYFRRVALTRPGSSDAGALAPFPALCQATGTVKKAIGWFGSLEAVQFKALKVTDVQGYRLGDQYWCIASVQWQLVAPALFTDVASRGCCTWTTRILMPLAEEGPRPRILEAGRLEAPADGQHIEWPADPTGLDLKSQELAFIRKSLESSSTLERAIAVMAYSMKGLLETSKLLTAQPDADSLDIAAGAAVETAAGAEWSSGDEDDLWNGLD
ncbi:PIN domain-containing protein [Streptomyces arboris]|uniref:PIN domain-containing protein n=1 Tax=Streptomyces arboris TaxID=2600619 RepID=UPI003BF510DF